MPNSTGTSRKFMWWRVIRRHQGAWAVLFICQLVWGVTGLHAFPNEPDGFYGLAWGTPLSEVKGTTLLRESVERIYFQVYSRPLEPLAPEGIAPESVEYEFWKGRFTLATVKIAALSSFIRLRDALFERYGRGYEPSERVERYYWKGARTNIALISRFDIS
jgi:hypothetical protein